MTVSASPFTKFNGAYAFMYVILIQLYFVFYGHGTFGNIAIRYRDRLYYLSSEEAKEKFVFNPLQYTSQEQKPLIVRCFL